MMNVNFSTSVPSEGWNLLRQAADEQQYLIIAPKSPKKDIRPILVDMLSLLLANKHMVMLAESRNAANLNLLRTFSPETRILKRGDSTCLFAELKCIPSAEKLCALPHNGLFGLRFAGFRDDVPSELIFSNVVDNHCFADIVIDFTYISERPALSISVCHEQMDAQTLVSIVRKTVRHFGDGLRINFAS